MKNNASFKLVALIILAGVVAAFIDPAPAHTSQKASAAIAHADAASAVAANATE